MYIVEGWQWYNSPTAKIQFTVSKYNGLFALLSAPKIFGHTLTPYYTLLVHPICPWAYLQNDVPHSNHLKEAPDQTKKLIQMPCRLSIQTVQPLLLLLLQLTLDVISHLCTFCCLDHKQQYNSSYPLVSQYCAVLIFHLSFFVIF